MSACSVAGFATGVGVAVMGYTVFLYWLFKDMWR